VLHGTVLRKEVEPAELANRLEEFAIAADKVLSSRG